jgi:hypothetical protein
MKKSLILTLILGLVVIMAVPASAFRIEGAKDTKFYFGALILTDIGAWSRDSDVFKTQLPGETDRTEMILNMPRHSRIRGVIESGSVGAYWEVRLGASQQGTFAAPGTYTGNGGAYATEGAKLYGYYKFGNCTFLAGKTDGHIYSVTAYQNLGFNNNNHLAGFGWGTIYDARVAQIRFSQDISKTFGYDITLAEPFYYTDNGGTTVSAAYPLRNSQAGFPLTAAKLRMNFGAVSLMPAGFVQYVKWNDLRIPGNDNPDDNMTSWGVVLPVVVKAGAFTGTFQGTYGQNLNGPLTLQSVYHRYQRVNGSIKDTTGWNGFADLAFTAGAVTPHFYIGYDRAENDDAYVGDKYNARMMYGVGVNWKITDNFYVVPEFTWYDYGKNPRVANNPNLGTEWLGGVQFQFVF